jgi:hypothetical protein
MRTIVTAALRRQYLQTELILWIRLVQSPKSIYPTLFSWWTRSNKELQGQEFLL